MKMEPLHVSNERIIRLKTISDVTLNLPAGLCTFSSLVTSKQSLRPISQSFSIKHMTLRSHKVFANIPSYQEET